MRPGISTKLLLAMLVAVILPLGASAVLLAVVTDWLFKVSVERRVHEGLERAPMAYRALFDSLKADFEHSTDAIITSETFCHLLGAGDVDGLRRHLAQQLEERDDLVGLVVVDEVGDELIALRGPPEGEPEDWRHLREERTVDGTDGELSLVARWVAPRRHFVAFQQAGRTLREWEAFQQGRTSFRNLTIVVYLGMVGVVLIVAVGLGFMMSRRVTTRVQRLCEATDQVAAGDLTTRVPVGPRDEVGELAATFNLMVARLLESRERIEYLQRVAAWQQLARRLAHEIKNPLTPIQLAIQEVRDRYHGHDENFERVLNQATEIVVEEVEALRRLTSEFSAFAKLPKVDGKEVDLRDFLEESGQSLKLHRSERAAVEVELPKAGVIVTVDKMLMKRVLDNLVRNAVDAIDGSGRSGKVVVRGGRDEEGAPLIAVEDDGPGIDGEELRRVFEPYYTTKETGTGLGLAIVKKIVLEHGGFVTLGSSAAEGTRFTIRLPR